MPKAPDTTRTCEACGKPVIDTYSYGRMPLVVNATPAKHGYVAIRPHDAGTFSMVLTGEDVDLAKRSKDPLHVLHSKSCR